MTRDQIVGTIVNRLRLADGGSVNVRTLRQLVPIEDGDKFHAVMRDLKTLGIIENDHDAYGSDLWRLV